MPANLATMSFELKEYPSGVQSGVNDLSLIAPLLKEALLSNYSVVRIQKLEYAIWPTRSFFEVSSELYAPGRYNTPLFIAVVSTNAYKIGYDATLAWRSKGLTFLDVQDDASQRWQHLWLGGSEAIPNMVGSPISADVSDTLRVYLGFAPETF